MEENQKKLQKYLTVVVNVGEHEDISDNLESVVSVFERKQMLENFLEFENQVGNIPVFLFSI